MARRLIWRFSRDAQVELGAWHDGRVVNVRGEAIEWVSAETGVRSWHPLGESPAVVQAWRQWLDRHEIVQPFKQAHREVYVLTDAERASSPASNRFAHHILRQHQLAALCRERGWHYQLQGEWDSSNSPTRVLSRWDLRVAIEVDGPPERQRMQSGVFTPPPVVRSVWLPFEGDRILSLILSKAFLLASDRTITDPVILRQFSQH